MSTISLPCWGDCQMWNTAAVISSDNKCYTVLCGYSNKNNLNTLIKQTGIMYPLETPNLIYCDEIMQYDS